MKYTRELSDSIAGRVFAVTIDVPDQYGAVLRSTRNHGHILCICENGTYMHKIGRQPAWEMKGKALTVKAIYKRQKRNDVC